MDERVVWINFLSGDRAAFTHIYNVYINSLFNYGIKIAPDSALVQDSIHDLFVDLWHNKDKMSETSSIKFYLYRSLKRKLIRVLERRKKQEGSTHEIKENFNLSFVFSHEMVIIEQQCAEETKNNLSKAIAGLTNRQKEALFLKFYEGLTNEQIASIMALNSQSVYNIIHQALKVLRQSYKHEVSATILFLLALLNS